MIIGVSGLKRSGKNTISSFLSKRYDFQEYSFAKPIKDISHFLFGWEEKDDEIKKEEIDESLGFSRRQFWQWFGTEVMQHTIGERFPSFEENVGRTIWVQLFLREYKKNPSVRWVISDVRFPHEVEAIQSLGGKIIHVKREDLENNDMHESEKYISTLPADFILENNSSISDLYKSTDTILENYLLELKETEKIIVI